MTDQIPRQSEERVRAAARILLNAGETHGWWARNAPTTPKTMEEFEQKDPIGFEEFLALVEDMLVAADKASKPPAPTASDPSRTEEKINKLALTIYGTWMSDERWTRMDLAAPSRAPLLFFWAEIAAKVAMKDEQFRIGGYTVDYTLPSQEALHALQPEVDALFAQSVEVPPYRGGVRTKWTNTQVAAALALIGIIILVVRAFFVRP